MKSGLVVAIIGGIGCGKSVACKFLSHLGYPIIDTDQVAKDLMQLGAAAYNDFVSQYGDRFLLPNGDIDRQKLATAFFNDSDLKTSLEGIIHPRVRQIVEKKITELKSAYQAIFIAIPVAHQVKQPAYQIDHVLLIECDQQQQLARTAARDQRTRAEVAKIVAHQADSNARSALADSIIYNNGTLEQLEQQLQAWLDSTILDKN